MPGKGDASGSYGKISCVMKMKAAAGNRSGSHDSGPWPQSAALSRGAATVYWSAVQRDC